MPKAKKTNKNNYFHLHLLHSFELRVQNIESNVTLQLKEKQAKEKQ